MIHHQLNTISGLGLFRGLRIGSLDVSPFWEAERFHLWKYIWPFLLIILFYCPPTFALDVKLQWDANTETNLAGYNVYYDTNSGAPYEGSDAQEGASPVDMPLALDENPDPDIVQFTLHNLPDGTYYFAVTAYNNEAPPLESDYSNEVHLLASGDTSPPIISNISVPSKSDTTAGIVWTTDEQSDSTVQFGTGTSTWGNYPANQSNGSLVTNHSINLSGLDPNTTYYFRVGSTDASDNTGTSIEMSFTTDPAPDIDAPSMVQFPTINYVNDTIDVTFNESNMQNATTEANYAFSPSLLFRSLGGSDDITFVGNNTYRLSMASVPSYLIFTLTVSNITDGADNAVSPSSIRINDNDNDGMADDWEAAFVVSAPFVDGDGDGLNNLEEYINSTNPNDSDTDGDNLPDGWEVAYGLDPNDSTGADGMNGDIDYDGWTNYEEYLNGYLPNNDGSPQASPPEIKETIPSQNSGITDDKRIPVDTSFSVRIEDLDGMDITDETCIKFTIDDGSHSAYVRDLSDAAFVRVIKLTSDADTQVTELWAVYDRSLDSYGSFAYDANVNIKVDARDRRGNTMTQAGYDFNIETLTEHNIAEDDRPETTITNNAGVTTLTIINNQNLAGFKVVYDSSEPITPKVEPLEEIPPLNLPGVTPVDLPVKLGPPTVFDNPVTIIMPYSGESDVRDLSLYLFDGTAWVYAVGSYNTGGVIQPAGEGWVVPGSLNYDDSSVPPVLEIQVYHFSGIQAGLSMSSSLVDLADSEAGGGCFIDTVTGGSPLGSPFYANKTYGYLSLFTLMVMVLAGSAWLRTKNPF